MKDLNRFIVYIARNRISMRYCILSIILFMFLLILVSFSCLVYGGLRCILFGFSRYSMDEIVHSVEFLLAIVGLSSMVFLYFFIKYFIMYYISLNMERTSDPVFPEQTIVLQQPIPFTGIAIDVKEEEDPINVSTT